MNENIVSENGTKLFPCKSISTQINSGPINSLFSTPKMGFVRLRKDAMRFAYVIELYQGNKIHSVNLAKPSDVFVLQKKKVNVIHGKEQVVFRFLYTHGVLKIVYENPSDQPLFEKLLTRCLDDEDLMDDQIDDDLKATLETVNTIEYSNVYTKRIIEDVDKLGDENRKEAKATATTANVNINNKSVNNTSTTTTATGTSGSSAISNKKFYANSNASPYSNRYDKENSVEKKIQVSKAHKRRHSPYYRDENFPDDNFIIGGVSIIGSQNATATTTTNLAQSALSPITPKRNCYDRFTSPSSGSVKIWNRNNSLGKSSGGKGFSNIGNTCYMNAILQCLLNIDLFSNDLLYTKQQLNGNLTQNCLYSSLCELYQVRDLNNESMQIQALKEVKNAISQEATRFSGHQQHDAHEFLCQVLDQLKEDVDKLKKNATTTSTSEQTMTTETTTTTTSVDIVSTNNSPSSVVNPIVENFEFHVTHTIQCTQCSEVIVKREEFNNLCLELPSVNTLQDAQISIQDALDIFFRDENVPFNCEKCKNNNVVIKHKFKRLPRILILYLKRYQFGDGNNLIKNDCSVDIPRYLTLNWLLDNEIEIPNKPSASVLQFMKANTQDNILKPAPLGTKELNHQSRLSISSPLASKLNSTLNSDTSSRRNRGCRKEIFQASASKNEPPVFTVADNDESEALPNLKSTDIHLYSPPRKDATYDENAFSLKDMSDDEQLQLALKQSMETVYYQEYARSPSLNSKTDNEFDAIKYAVDGNFDLVSSDEENHVVNTKDEDEDENNKGIPKERDLFDRMKGVQNYGMKKRTVKEKREPHSKQMESLTATFKRSSSFQDNDLDDPYAAEREKLKKKKNAFNSLMPNLTASDISEDILKCLSTNNDKQAQELEQQQQQHGGEQHQDDNVKIKRSEEQQRIIDENSKTGKEANSYRLVGIVSHLGVSSNSGHYICDVLNLKTKTWSSFDDKKVETLNENDVLYKRSKTGYILFYIHNSMEEAN